MQEEIKHISAIYRVLNWGRLRAVLGVETIYKNYKQEQELMEAHLGRL